MSHKKSSTAAARSSLEKEASVSPYGVQFAGPSDACLLTPRQAAQRLGIRTTTLYGWLGLARIGELLLRGERFALQFLQTGPRGQGRILIAESEVDRLREHLVVRPRPVFTRKPPTPRTNFPGIHVPLGRPDQPSGTRARPKS